MWECHIKEANIIVTRSPLLDHDWSQLMSLFIVHVHLALPYCKKHQPMISLCHCHTSCHTVTLPVTQSHFLSHSHISCLTVTLSQSISVVTVLPIVLLSSCHFLPQWFQFVGVKLYILCRSHTCGIRSSAVHVGQWQCHIKGTNITVSYDSN